jgi:hypothetical protein
VIEKASVWKEVNRITTTLASNMTRRGGIERTTVIFESKSNSEWAGKDARCLAIVLTAMASVDGLRHLQDGLEGKKKRF